MTLAACLLVLLGAVVWFAVKYGGKSEKSAGQQRDLKAVSNAKKIRDKLNTDPSFRERVRRRFTR